MSHILNVLLTVDTEIGGPLSRNWMSSSLEREWSRDIDGTTPEGDYGVAFQMQVLAAHGLNATFFVESMFAEAAGPGLLERLVRLIDSHGHDVQLHMHPEWLARMAEPVVPARGQNLRDFPVSEQAELIARSAAALRAAGAKQLTAFRAGNYGANFDTLAALRTNGLRLDASYSAPHLGLLCALHMPAPLVQPTWIDGVLEFPLGCFEEWPGRYRPLQLCACSTSELIWALNAAWARRWHYLVMIFHSFELIQRGRHIDETIRPNKMVIRRFERLCRFLAENRSRFRTTVFSDIDPDEIPASTTQPPLQSRIFRTALRYVEQLQNA